MNKQNIQQLSLVPARPNGSLLKWIGNKFKYAERIAGYFPVQYNRYVEPFVGSGAVLATLAPTEAIASDTLKPLIELWKLIQKRPNVVTAYYREVICQFLEDRQETYSLIKEKYNSDPNGLDLLIISRTCYGGVLRFTREGRISTPIGPHTPIAPESFEARVKEWRERIKNVQFLFQDYATTLKDVGEGDIVYCDPPYVDSQSILYGAQSFSIKGLFEAIEECKKRGAKVALSIDGKKKSGTRVIDVPIPAGLFEREFYFAGGGSMLKRFQNGGENMIGEHVHERLLLTW